MANRNLTFINFNEPHELNYWASFFKVTSEEIINAIDIVGPDLKSVEGYVRSQEKLFETKRSKIVLSKGDIINTNASLIVIPKSTNGNFSEHFIIVLEQLGINNYGAQKTGLGDSEFQNVNEYIIPNIPQNNNFKKNLKGILLSTTVDDQSSSYAAIRNISLRLAEQTHSGSTKSVASPLLGTGAGGLEKEKVFQIMAAAFNENAAKDSVLYIYDYDERSYNYLKSIPLSPLRSIVLTLIEITKYHSNSLYLKEIVQEKSFYFLKAQAKLKEFIDYAPLSIPQSSFYSGLLSLSKKHVGPFEDLLDRLDKKSQEYQFLILIGKLIAHIDSKAYNKNIWNEYNDKRTLARSAVRQNNWVENLIQYKIDKELKNVSPSIANAISYLSHPGEDLTMLSENHRKLVLGIIFETRYEGKESLKIIFDFFDPLINLVNPLNRGYLFSRILYLNEVKSLWQKEQYILNEEVSIIEKGEIKPVERIAKSNNYEQSRIKACIHSDVFAETDLLNYNIYAHTIVQFIKHPDTRPPLTIGIMAPWGKGKTTMMRFIKKKLDQYSNSYQKKEEANENVNKEITEDLYIGIKTRYKQLNDWLVNKSNFTVQKLKNPTVWFNAWKFQKSEQIWAGFAHEIIDQLVNKLPTEFEKERFWLTLNLKRVDKRKIKDKIVFALFNKILRATWFVPIILIILFSLSLVYFNFTSTLIINAIGLTSYSIIIRIIYNKFKTEKIDFDIAQYIKQPNYGEKLGYFHQVEADLKYALEILVSKEEPVVIFIDDLDRCSPKTVAEIVEAINLFISGDFPDCYFILGQDAQMVAAALDAAYKDIEAKVENIQKNNGSLGWYFMEKFIQLQFNIPNISLTQSRVFLETLLNQQDEQPSEKGKIVNKEYVEERYKKLVDNIANLGNNDDFVSFSKDVEDLEKETPSLKPERILLLKEKVIDRAALNFNDSDSDVLEVIEVYAEYLGNSPRLIKRFVNLYRFYRFLQFSGQNPQLSNIEGYALGRWIILMIKWPQLVRCIQWDTEKSFHNGSTAIMKATEFEALLLGCNDFKDWEKKINDSYSNGIPWLFDKNLFEFVKKTNRDFGSLKEAIEVGFW
jgi:hypothetical protein